LANADKPESQEICFVPDRDYSAFVRDHAERRRIRDGRIYDAEGRELAHHDGIHQFTIGQRRGLGITAPAPLYVQSIDTETGNVTVGPRAALVSAGLVTGRVHLTHPEILGSNHDEASVAVKVRSRHKPVSAAVRLVEDDRARVRFPNGGPAVTPGQACVFYRGDEVLGGGIIESKLEM
jgi:tRNA-specific 2-thiouridylase